jgi:hypothetical protein
MPENYLNILTVPIACNDPGLSFGDYRSRDLAEPPFVGMDLILELPDCCHFVGRNIPAGKMDPAGFSENLKKIFIHLNTLSKS